MNFNPRKLIFLITGILAVATIASLAFYWQPLVAWYEFQRDFETLPVNAQGLPEYKHRQTGIIFVKVPGGTFMMGSPEDEVGRQEEEGPQHEVTLSPFLISKYEISQEIWVKVMGSNPSSLEGANLPVDKVSWNDVYGDSSSFCKKLGLKLPTEAQWEYACRAGSLSPFSFGSNLSTAEVNYNGNYPYNGAAVGEYRRKAVAVDSFRPNGFGLYNMHGNVSEWCEDYYRFGYSESKISNSAGTTIDGSRVVRGGGWSDKAVNVRSAARWAGHPVYWKGSPTGFRPVRNLE